MISERERQAVEAIAWEIYEHMPESDDPHDRTDAQDALAELDSTLDILSDDAASAMQFHGIDGSIFDGVISARECWVRITTALRHDHLLTARLLAAKYLGAIETANSSTVEEIEEAARVADAKIAECRYESVAPSFRGSWCSYHSALEYRHGYCVAAWRTFDSSAFWTAIANEGIAKGEPFKCESLDGCTPGAAYHEGACVPAAIPSWFDDHARFVIPKLVLQRAEASHD